MKTKKWTKLPGAVMFLLLGALGAFLRLRALDTGLDQRGLNVQSADVTLLIVFSAAVAVLALIYGLVQRPVTAWADFAPQSRAVAGLQMLSALALTASAGLTLLSGGGVFCSVVALLGIAAGACQLFGDAQTFGGKKPASLPQLLPIVYFILLLIYDFRHWSVDPVVIEYCFKLFALISVMLAVFCLAGYSFDRGHRKTTTLFCALAVYFCVLSLADGGAAQLLLFAACALRAFCGLLSAALARE